MKINLSSFTNKKIFMKKIVLFSFLVEFSVVLIAQSPPGFNYQAVIRDAEGQPLVEQAVSIRLTLQNEDGTTEFYTETHNTSTSPQGIASIVVGSGSANEGDLTDIPWEVGGVYLKVEVDPTQGGTFYPLGISQLQAVPYSLYAASGVTGPEGPEGPEGPLVTGTEGQTLRHNGTSWVASSNIHNADANVGIGTVTPTEKLEVAGNIKALGRLIGQSVEVNQPQSEEEPIFVVRNSAGQIVFAVYEGGVRAYVDDTSKQTRGGFAIGGLSDQTKEEGIQYFSLTPDSVRFNIKAPITKQTRGGFAIGGLSDQTKSSPTNLLYIGQDSARIYIDTDNTNSNRGGFAVGGQSDQTNGMGPELLRITPDSTRIYVNNTPNKGTKGGFAISGLGTKYEENSFMFLTPDNYFIGHKSGEKLEGGVYNSFFGYSSGANIIEGSSNIFIGYESGYSTDTANYNVFIGDKAGWSNTKGDLNVFIGNIAGFANTIGRFNTFVGNQAGYSNTEGQFNSFYGEESGAKNKTGNENTYIGERAGYNNITGSHNFFGGASAFYSMISGDNNVGIGDQTGNRQESGNNNVYIGSYSAWDKTGGNNNVIIGALSGTENSNGENNVFIGAETGRMNTGSNNVFLGSNAGYNEHNSNRLYIENSSADSTGTLIYGEFDNEKLLLNAEVTINDVMKLTPRSTAPDNPIEGTIYYDAVIHKLKVWNGAEWRIIAFE
jgi:hypothetical protein